jgi:hypothetical protein
MGAEHDDGARPRRVVPKPETMSVITGYGKGRGDGARRRPFQA